MEHRPSRPSARALIAGCALMVCSTPARPAIAADGAAGTAQVTGQGGGLISSGGSSTNFSLRLPKAAACNRDSAHGNYRVQSYMVPASDDPSGLTFRSQGPLGSGQRPLYDTFTSAYVNAQTANADPEDGPGVIVDIPMFNYAVFGPGDISPGPYNIGIACTLMGKVDGYWNARTTVTSESGDKPAGFSWQLADGQGTPTGRPRTGWILGGAALAAAGGLFLWGRRRAAAVPMPASASPLAKEPR